MAHGSRLAGDNFFRRSQPPEGPQSGAKQLSDLMEPGFLSGAWGRTFTSGGNFLFQLVGLFGGTLTSCELSDVFTE